MYAGGQHAHPSWPAASYQLIPFSGVWAQTNCLGMLGPFSRRVFLLLFGFRAGLSGTPLSPRAAGSRRAVCRRADSRGQERSKNALPSILRPVPPARNRGVAGAAPAAPQLLQGGAARMRRMRMREPPPRSHPRCALSFTQAFWSCVLRRKLPLEMLVMHLQQFLVQHFLLLKMIFSRGNTGRKME